MDNRFQFKMENEEFKMKAQAGVGYLHILQFQFLTS